MGCDVIVSVSFIVFKYFNPRTHRGVRQDMFGLTKESYVFQSTHPSWGATRLFRLLVHSSKYFNPRTHRGVRHVTIVVSDFLPIFQSTHPSWGATLCGYAKKFDSMISIHAPIVGCDEFTRLLWH